MGSDPGQKKVQVQQKLGNRHDHGRPGSLWRPGRSGKAIRRRARGAAGATFILRALGDPCDGVDHPAYQSDARGAIVDAVQDYQGVETSQIYLVEKVAVKDGWAYIETGLWQGPGSGDPDAFILRAENATWTVLWEGDTGAQPGDGEEGNLYPKTDLGDQHMLMCQTLCASDNET